MGTSRWSTESLRLSLRVIPKIRHSNGPRTMDCPPPIKITRVLAFSVIPENHPLWFPLFGNPQNRFIPNTQSKVIPYLSQQDYPSQQLGSLNLLLNGDDGCDSPCLDPTTLPVAAWCASMGATPFHIASLARLNLEPPPKKNDSFAFKLLKRGEPPLLQRFIDLPIMELCFVGVDVYCL